MSSLKLALARAAQVAVKRELGVAATYAAFLDAIAARSFDDVCQHATDRLRADLQKMRGHADFAVLFGLWCESYPRAATFLSIYCEGETAIVDVQGDVAGERVYARILLRRLDGKWHVDRERFDCRGSNRRAALERTQARNSMPSKAEQTNNLELDSGDEEYCLAEV